MNENVDQKIEGVIEVGHDFEFVPCVPKAVMKTLMTTMMKTNAVATFCMISSL